jgi:murein L,D-transpeptidase YafK
MPALAVLLIALASQAAAVPASDRSRAATARVTPGLNKELKAAGLSLGSPVFIRIFKQPAELEIWVQKDTRFQRFRSYSICRFSGKLGPKQREGDRQAPEGCYFVNASRMNPKSRFHLSFNLGYPNDFDRQHGRTGSALMVHGACASIGCYAMGDKAIEEIWTLCSAALAAGQPFFRVHCFPFPLTPAKLRAQIDSPWVPFWAQLRPIYQRFENTQIPPDVIAKNRRYQLND